MAKALDKQSIQKRMAAIYWGMKRHTDEFSWGKEGMRVRHISLDQVAQCSNLEELDELSTIDTMSLKCPNKHSRELCVHLPSSYEPKVEDGIVFYIEDPNGLLLPVTIKFLTSIPCYSLSIKNILDESYPAVTILAIKEPIVRYGRRDGNAICVDLPTDLVEIHPKDKLDIPSAKILPAAPLQDLEWESVVKDLGNESLQDKNPIIVAKHYTSALAYPEVKGSSSHQLPHLISFPLPQPYSSSSRSKTSDYLGPIHSRMIPGRNTRGLVLSDPVKAGDLLLVSKAIVATYATDVGNAILPCVDNDNEDYIPPSTYAAINRAAAVVRALYDLPKNCELLPKDLTSTSPMLLALISPSAKTFDVHVGSANRTPKTEYELRYRLVEEVNTKLLDDYDKHFTSV
ncbi:hypothetical protein I352_03205 [Cryptococcus deuterogattii MMRL2647]|nr:hypothetical protein I352_03205 [Cryptococcus deuterogattii MMRL2647]